MDGRECVVRLQDDGDQPGLIVEIERTNVLRSPVLQGGGQDTMTLNRVPWVLHGP